MLIKKPRRWELPETAVTDEVLYLNRRTLAKGLAAGTILAAGGGAALWATSAESAPLGHQRSADLYPVGLNPELTGQGLEVTGEDLVTRYNNFYEFGSHKYIQDEAEALSVDPWSITFDGMVEEEQTVDFDTIVRQMPLEERIVRHRCVEAWSFVAPFSGFPMKALVDFARPLGSAKYVRMETFMDADVAPGQKAFWYPWPYIEGLTMAEATNDLAFIATGLYGKPIPQQNGAPIRLHTPWKYGFKHIKSIVRFTFTDERPVSFWEELQGSEYGFWANINPAVPHPRWSQATERVLGKDGRIDTLLYNGYEEWVGHLYAEMDLPDTVLYR